MLRRIATRSTLLFCLVSAMAAFATIPVFLFIVAQIPVPHHAQSKVPGNEILKTGGAASFVNPRTNVTRTKQLLASRTQKRSTATDTTAKGARKRPLLTDTEDNSDEVELEYDRVLSQWDLESRDYMRNELELSEEDIDDVLQLQDAYQDQLDRIELMMNEDEDALTSESAIVQNELHASAANYENGLRSILGEKKYLRLLEKQEDFNQKIEGKYAGMIRTSTF